MNACTVCHSPDTTELLRIPQVPAHCNLLWDSREAARQATKGDIHLTFCRQCGHLFNAAFDPGLMAYTQDYENSLHFSPRFQQFAGKLADRLVERYDLRGKTIIELGSGQGDFLRMLCERGGNRGLGFDPAYVPESERDTLGGRIQYVQDFYSEKYTHHRADFILSRHVLEHIEQPAAFVRMVRRAIAENHNTVVYFEVPNVMYTLRELGIWDIIYEHCSYFSPASLHRVFSRNGFKIHHLESGFGGQFLGIEASPLESKRPGGFPAPDPAEMAAAVQQFAQNYRQKVNEWGARLSRFAEGGRRVVTWGAGSKGNTFLNVLKAEQIAYIVDINPRKQGKFVVGLGQEIVPPEFLRQYRPEVVIIMNPNYREEIAGQLAELGVQAEILLA